MFFFTGPRRCVHLDLEPPYLLDHTPGTWDPEFPTQWGSLSSWVCAEPLSQVHSSKVTPLIPGPDRFLVKRKRKRKKWPTWSKTAKDKKRRVTAQMKFRDRSEKGVILGITTLLHGKRYAEVNRECYGNGRRTQLRWAMWVGEDMLAKALGVLNLEAWLELCYEGRRNTGFFSRGKDV